LIVIVFRHEQDHPTVAPLAYVKPTADMYVAPSHNDVEPDGRIILPYLKAWRHPTSDLANLLVKMSEAFSQSPPVYSHQSRSTPYPVQHSSMPQPQQNYGYPTSGYTQGSYPLGGYPQQHLPEQIYKDSLVSALIDKVKYRLEDLTMTSKAEIESLRRTEDDLVHGERQLQSMLNECQQQETQAQNYIATLRTKINEMKEANGKMSSSSSGETLKDDAIITTAPIYKQLLQAYSEEHAIQDLLYFLGDGHRRKSIGLDIYLKHVRELSRRQFILRATMHKCRQVAGLPLK